MQAENLPQASIDALVDFLLDLVNIAHATDFTQCGNYDEEPCREALAPSEASHAE